MENFQDFLKNIASQADNDTIMTSDGVELPRDAVECVILIFSHLTSEKLKELSVYDVFERLAVNFIQNNAKCDIDKFLMHNALISTLEKLL